jgi:uncharacterized membrane protein
MTWTARKRALALAGFLGAAGTTHFIAPSFYDQMIPSQLPGTARQWTHGSGVLEMAVGTSIAFPATRKFGGLFAALLFVGVFPGNVQMAVDSFRRDAPTIEKGAMLARLPLQIPLVLWALRVRREARSSA